MVARASAVLVCLLVCVMQLDLNSGTMPSFRGLKTSVENHEDRVLPKFYVCNCRSVVLVQGETLIKSVWGRGFIKCCFQPLILQLLCLLVSKSSTDPKWPWHREAPPQTYVWLSHSSREGHGRRSWVEKIHSLEGFAPYSLDFGLVLDHSKRKMFSPSSLMSVIH